MSDMGFKFEIGDVVKLAVSANQSASWMGKTIHRELRGLIVERRLEECPGGIQRHYTIRFVRSDGEFSDNTRHNEIELVASEPFPETDKA